MNYYIDTEFIESGPDEPIYLISIGIVAEDGREVYLQNADCPLEKASDWVKENIIPNLQCKPYEDIGELHISGPATPFFINRSEHKTYNLSTNCIDNIWLRLKDIGKILVEFIGDDPNIQFWGYYADYDWVVFCQIFGTMMDLPKGRTVQVDLVNGDVVVGKFPMYCNDLKQLAVSLGNPTLPKQSNLAYCSACKNAFEMPSNTFSSHCGIQGSVKLLTEHNALADARWNKKAYEYLMDLATKARKEYDPFVI